MHGRNAIVGGLDWGDGGAPAMVYVWDPAPVREQDLSRALSDCGVRIVLVSSSRLEGLAPNHNALAVVVLESDGTTDPLRVVRFFRQWDVEVLAIHRQKPTMSLGERCRVLLAGGSAVLEANAEDFSSHLRGWTRQKLEARVLRAKELERVRNTMLEMEIVGQSSSLMSAFHRLLKVSALSDVPVLIQGESGTGKELFARALQRLDPKRSRGPFISINCAAISAQLVESELFGHRKGAFTGAERCRRGLVRSADGGTLFLDEVGELDPGLQAKMLRVLQEKRVLGVGEDAEVPVDVRFIAATNRPLDQMVKTRTFREDLYHRLNVVSINIPPLRERQGDIPLLVEHFLRKYADTTAGRELSVSADFVHALCQLELRGNARELENLIRQVLLNKMNGDELNLLDLPEGVWHSLAEKDGAAGADEIANATDAATKPAQDEASIELVLFQNLLASSAGLSASLRHCEKILLRAALQRAGGNQSETARLLGITPRSVYNKLRRHHVAA